MGCSPKVVPTMFDVAQTLPGTGTNMLLKSRATQTLKSKS